MHRRVLSLVGLVSLVACSSQPAASAPAGQAGSPQLGAPVVSAGQPAATAAGARAPVGTGTGGVRSVPSSGTGALAGKPAAAVSGGAGAAAPGGMSAAGSGGAAGASGAAGSARQPAAGSGAERCQPDLDPTQPPGALALSGDLGTHDPVMIEADGQFYEFQTGRGIPMKRSKDLMSWQGAGSVFSSNPAWIAQKVSGATDLWAPDISFFGGAYHLYYSASTFGSNHSCIGHASTPSLADPKWTDHGPVICSNDGKNDDWNAIDPNLVQAEGGALYLALGSFWSGLKLIELDANGMRKGDKLTALASRPQNNGAIEAAFIVQRCGYYYLFASYDTCCKGKDSTYNIRVGRSRDVAGPYMDRDGKGMLQGGGTQLLKGNATWAGPGHNAVLFSSRGVFNVYHAYYAAQSSGAFRTDASYLHISELAWDDQGWPVSGGP